MPQPVPSLDELVRDPRLALSLPAEVLAALAARIAVIQSALVAAQFALAADGGAPTAQAAQPDELLTVEQAAGVLSVPVEWVYKRARRLGLVVQLGQGTLRISRAKLDAYIRGQAVTSTGAMRRKRALD